MTQFKVLSDEEIDKAWPGNVLSNLIVSKEQIENELLRCGQHVAQAAKKDTLRQVVEMLDGIENPFYIPMDNIPPDLQIICKKLDDADWDLAIQTIKQAIEVGK